MTSRPRLLAATLLAALVLAGCSSTVDGRATTASAGGGDSSTASTVTEDDLDAILLTVEDLPAGFELDPPDEGSDGSDGESTYEPAVCAEVFGEDDGNDPVAEREVAFLATDELVSQQVVLVDGAAADELDPADDVLEECAEFTETDADGAVTSYTVEQLRLGGFGEQTLALRLTVSDDGGTVFRFDAVAVAVGPVGLFYLAGGNDYLDTDELGALVDLGVQRAVEAGA